MPTTLTFSGKITPVHTNTQPSEVGACWRGGATKWSECPPPGGGSEMESAQPPSKPTSDPVERSRVERRSDEAGGYQTLSG